MISLSEDEHRDTQLLLPWYGLGQLDEADRTLVEAHLADCAACRAELEAEERLARLIQSTSPAAGEGWATLRARIQRGQDGGAQESVEELPAGADGRRSRRSWTRLSRGAMKPAGLRWIVAAQFAALLVMGALAFGGERPAAYRALGEEAVAPPGNVLAMFRPDASETDLRRSLNAVGARLVGGPTSANAYVLEVPGGSGGRQLDALRRDPNVTMAEPIDVEPAE